MQLLAMENHFDFALFAQAGVAGGGVWEGCGRDVGGVWEGCGRGVGRMWERCGRGDWMSGCSMGVDGWVVVE